MYHHFEYPHQSLASLHRALRRNGEVFLIDFNRVPGVSSDWILNHVRAGQEVVTAEFEAAGFEKVEEIPLLKDNYTLRFRKVGRSDCAHLPPRLGVGGVLAGRGSENPGPSRWPYRLPCAMTL